MLLKLSLLFLTVSLFKVKYRQNLRCCRVSRSYIVVHLCRLHRHRFVRVCNENVRRLPAAHFVRDKNVHATADIRRFVDISMLKHRAQLYFWFEIDDLIGTAYRPYADAAAALRGEPSNFQDIYRPDGAGTDPRTGRRNRVAARVLRYSSQRADGRAREIRSTGAHDCASGKD